MDFYKLTNLCLMCTSSVRGIDKKKGTDKCREVYGLGDSFLR